MLTLVQFKEQNKDKFKMTHEAWQLYYESYLDKHQPEKSQKIQIGNLFYSLLEDFQSSSEGQKYSQNQANLWKGEVKFIIKQLIKQNDLKQLITALQREQNENIKYQPLVKKNKQEERKILDKIQEHELTQKEEQIVKQKKKLSSLMDPPQQIVDAQFEKDIRYFYPEKRSKQQNEFIPKISHQNKVQLVNERNIHQMKQKREELEQKTAEKEYLLDMRQENKDQSRNVKRVQNFMMQQDADENRARRLKIENYKRDLLAQKVQNKIQKIEHIQQEKIRSQHEREMIRKKFGLQKDFIQFIVEATESQQIPPQFAKTLITNQMSQTQTQKMKIDNSNHSKLSNHSKQRSQSFQKQRRNQRLQHELVELSLKHQFELQMIIKREQLAEVNRENLLNELNSEQMRETYEKQFRIQREQAKQRIENVMKKQEEERNILYKTYS